MGKKIVSFLLAFLLSFSLVACGADYYEEVDIYNGDYSSDSSYEELLPEDGSYTTKDDVALYLYQYGHLPFNFITKDEARALGWERGSLDPYAPGMCIGGDHFGNYEGLLPDDYSYIECDINTLGKESRGAERIVYSTDGALIYYTPDHYESFELMYGEE